MDAIQINQTVEIIPLLGYELKKAGGYHVGACPFCGGKDRFTVKHTRDGDRWHCRQCGDGKYHTAIDYIMRRDNADFKTALKILGGDVQKNITPRKVTPIPPKPINIPSADWQREAWQEIDAATAALSSSRIAVDFLLSRAIHAGAWEAWRLGVANIYDPIAKRKRPALVIPWYDLDSIGETLTAVKYRFMDSDPNPKALRYSCKSGSAFDIPFGLWTACPRPVESLPVFQYLTPNFDNSLLLIEGELNCISVWQCRPRGLSVLSFGSEGSGDVRTLQAIAARYQNVSVWADDVWTNSKQAKHAKELRALIRGRGIALRSVIADGIKQDANQLLQAGNLPAFLSHVLKVEFD